MEEFFNSTPVQLVIALTALAILTVISAFVVKKFRDRNDDDRPTANDLLTNFRELHDEGDISEKEYRNIKTVLGDKLHQELSDNGEQG
jgi:uncharacterized membrane protein